MRVSILTNMIPPYRVPVFEALAKDVDLRVLVCVEREADREWSHSRDKSHYPVKRLCGPTITVKNRVGEVKRIIHLKWSVVSELALHRPNVLVVGDASWTSFAAAYVCRLLKIRYAWWSEQTGGEEQTLAALIRRACIRNASAWITPGSSATDFLTSQGIPKDSVHEATNCVDTHRFESLRSETAGRRKELRAKLGIPDEAFALLYVGQLIERKRVYELLQAAARVNRAEKAVHLILAGSGPQRDRLELAARQLEYSSYTMTGFLDERGLSECFAAADALALVSQNEPWGLVVNEALQFGLPILASTSVGAAADLVGEKTGVTIRDCTIEGISDGIRCLVNGSFHSVDCIAAVSDATPERVAARFREAASSARAA